MSYGRRAGKRPVTGSLVAPGTVGTLAAWLIFENSGSQMYAAAAGFSGAQLVFTLPAGATGVSIDAGSGVLTADTAVAAIQSGTTLTVRATNATNFAEQNLSFTVATVKRRRPVNRSSAAVYRSYSW
jgi:hypothetical protein